MEQLQSQVNAFLKNKKQPPKPITEMRKKVNYAIKTLKMSGHKLYISEVNYPAYNHSGLWYDEETAIFIIKDSSSGHEIKLKITIEENIDDIMTYIVNYKIDNVKKGFYTYLHFI